MGSNGFMTTITPLHHIRVALERNPYEVVIGAGGLARLGQQMLNAVMLVTLWKGLGYYMVIFLAGLQGIPKELYEAAELDGSEGWRKHLDITLPLMSPYVTLVAVVSSIAATKVFEEVCF